VLKLVDRQQELVLSEVLDNENIEDFSLHVDCGFDRDYVDLVTPGT
jgi:hypothetical protein